MAYRFNILAFRLQNGKVRIVLGERSSVGRALDCGSSGRGFKPRRSPRENINNIILLQKGG